MQKWQCMRKILFNQLELYRHNEIQNGNCNFGWLYVVRGERWAENVYKFGKCVKERFGERLKGYTQAAQEVHTLALYLCENVNNIENHLKLFLSAYHLENSLETVC